MQRPFTCPGNQKAETSSQVISVSPPTGRLGCFRKALITHTVSTCQVTSTQPHVSPGFPWEPRLLRSPPTCVSSLPAMTHTASPPCLVFAKAVAPNAYHPTFQPPVRFKLCLPFMHNSISSKISGTYSQ